MFVYKEGRGTLEYNDIFANAGQGVQIRTGGDPVLRHNRINQNRYHAIGVYEGGGGTFEDNDLRNNERGAWEIDQDCESKITRRNNQE